MRDEAEPIDHSAWPERALLLLGLGAVSGLVFHFLIRGQEPWSQTDDPLRVAAAAWVAVSGIVFALSLERLRWIWSAAFALVGGLVVAGVTYWNGAPSGWGSDEGWHFAACLLAVAVAVPLFQTIRDEGRLRVSPRPAHAYVWSNLILAAAVAFFVLATFLLTFLLSELFKLIGIRLLADLLNRAWFPWMLGCGALGAAVGILRDRDKVLGALQRVVRAVLSFLAPVLALGLVLFVLALPVTGLKPLWEQTKATTPILLFCIAGAVVLANAVIGNAAEEEPAARPMRWAAAALGAVMLPLALVAAVSTFKRIGQYGYTPERLWALVFVAIALAAALAYLVALIRGRGRWPDLARRFNLHLAAGVCLLALFLALPIVSFGALSTRDQVARLTSGKVAPEKFDWAALRFDFGPSGRRAAERLAASGPASVRPLAAKSLVAKSRYDLRPDEQPVAPEELRLVVDDARPVPEALRRTLASRDFCGDRECRLVFTAPGEVVVLQSICDTCTIGSQLLTARPDGSWASVQQAYPVAPVERGTLRTRRVELRAVEKRQVFIDGQPVGDLFDPPS